MGRVLQASGAEVDDRFFTAGGDSSAKGPFLRWVAKRLTYLDFATAGTTNPVLAFEVPAHTVIHDALLEVETDFAGGGITAYTAALGISGGDVDAFIEETSVFTGATNDALLNVNMDTGASGADPTKGARGALLWDSTVGDEHVKMGYYVGTSAIEVDVNAVSTTANLNAATAGALIVYMLVSNPREAFVDSGG